jgi:hypothetical protein
MQRAESEPDNREYSLNDFQSFPPVRRKQIQCRNSFHVDGSRPLQLIWIILFRLQCHRISSIRNKFVSRSWSNSFLINTMTRGRNEPRNQWDQSEEYLLSTVMKDLGILPRGKYKQDCIELFYWMGSSQELWRIYNDKIK